MTSAGARAAAKRDDAISTLKEKQQPFFLWIISVRVGERASFFPPSPYHIRAFLKIKKEKSEQFLQVVSVDDFSLSLSLYQPLALHALAGTPFLSSCSKSRSERAQGEGACAAAAFVCSSSFLGKKC